MSYTYHYGNTVWTGRVYCVLSIVYCLAVCRPPLAGSSRLPDILSTRPCSRLFWCPLPSSTRPRNGVWATRWTWACARTLCTECDGARTDEHGDGGALIGLYPWPGAPAVPVDTPRYTSIRAVTAPLLLCLFAGVVIRSLTDWSPLSPLFPIPEDTTLSSSFLSFLPFCSPSGRLAALLLFLSFVSRTSFLRFSRLTHPLPLFHPNGLALSLFVASPVPASTRSSGGIALLALLSSALLPSRLVLAQSLRYLFLLLLCYSSGAARLSLVARVVALLLCCCIAPVLSSAPIETSTVVCVPVLHSSIHSSVSSGGTEKRPVVRTSLSHSCHPAPLPFDLAVASNSSFLFAQSFQRVLGARAVPPCTPITVPPWHRPRSRRPLCCPAKPSGACPRTHRSRSSRSITVCPLPHNSISSSCVVRC